MPEPLYLQITGALRRGILSGEYRPGDMLPSENELAARHGTSRVTVRKSLGVLESERLIRPWHGKGYFVLPPKYTSFTLDFGESLTDGHFRFQEVNIVRPSKEVTAVLLLRKNQMVIVTRRVLERGGQSVAFDEKFIPYERGVPSIELELHFAEFPGMFEKRFAPLSLRTEMTIGLETAPEHVCAALGVRQNTPLLVVSRLIRAVDGQPDSTPTEKSIGYGKQYMTETYGKLTAKSGYHQQDNF